ncbi:hypothetical protein WJX82_010197 [Trebouxia sp. C0006]
MHSMHNRRVFWGDLEMAGTPDYMAPETIAAAVDFDGMLVTEEDFFFSPMAADWWSVGAVLFEAATGKALFGPSCSESNSTTSSDELAHDLAATSKAKCNDSDDPDAHFMKIARPIHQCHLQWKEHGMEDVWQKVQQASHDPALLSFLQHLLTQDPLQRSSGALICQHPFLHMPDTTLVPSHPSQPVVSFLSGRPDESQLQQVPGMPDVFWQPAKPLGITGTGTINWLDRGGGF